MTKRIITLAVALVAQLPLLWAYDFESNGLYYSIIDAVSHEVSVSSAWMSGESVYEGVVLVPESVHYAGDNYAVTAIGEGAFAHSRITQVVLPNTVAVIGEGAFEGASDLHSVTLPLSLRELGAWSFARTDLVNVAIPEGVTAIGEGAFYSCNMLHTVFLPSSLTRIGAYAFSYCHNLYELYFAGSMPPAAVGWGAFDGARKCDVVLRDDAVAEVFSDSELWGDSKSFGVFADESLAIEVKAESEAYGSGWMLLRMPGVSLCYRVYDEYGTLVQLTASQKIYLPATDHDVSYTIVPGTIVGECDALTVDVPQATGIDKIIDDSFPAREEPRIYAWQGIIFVEGDNYGEWTRVYDMGGCLRFVQRAFSGQIAKLPRGEVYIVCVGRYAKKIRL